MDFFRFDYENRYTYPIFFLISSFCQAQIVDAATSGNENIRAIEGGCDRVSIDTKTPLNERLDNPWKFVETGKAYWIGYTDDSSSILLFIYQSISVSKLKVI